MVLRVYRCSLLIASIFLGNYKAENEGRQHFEDERAEWAVKWVKETILEQYTTKMTKKVNVVKSRLQLLVK